MILEDRNLCDQALDQCLVKLHDRGGLALDEVLQVLDQAHLLILDHAVDFGLLSHILEPENLISDGIAPGPRLGTQRPLRRSSDIWSRCHE